MALTFAEASTNSVNYGTALGNVTALSMGFWFYPITLTQFNSITGLIGGANAPIVLFGTASGDQVRIGWARATTNMIYISNNAALTTNKWWFVGITADQAGGVGTLAHIYVGDLTTLATERTYGTSQDGSGAFTSNSGIEYRIGDKGAASESGNFRMADHFVYPGVVLTQAQFQLLQYRPHLAPLISGLKLYTIPGLIGTGTQPDWSGTGNTGAVTGATVSDGPPLGPPF